MNYKKLVFVIIFGLTIFALTAQIPTAFKYQGLIRGLDNQPIASQQIEVELIIKEGRSTVYTEFHDVTTSPDGIFSLNIGEGDIDRGAFEDINWADGNVSMDIAIDGELFDEDIDFLSVPYALYAANSEKGDKGDPFIYEDFTPEQLEALIGPKGERGEKGDQGDQGEKGDTGNGIQIVGSLPSSLDLPSSYSGNIGDLYIIQNSGRGYAWNGSSWDDVGEIRGPQGERGIQGERGFTGDRGDRGEMGDPFRYEDFTNDQLERLRGPQGERGERGLQGERGERGDPGPVGSYSAGDGIRISNNSIINTGITEIIENSRNLTFIKGDGGSAFSVDLGQNYLAGDGIRISNDRIENIGVTAMQHDDQSLQYRIGGTTRTFTPSGGASYSAGDGVRISNNRIENTGVTAMQHNDQSLQYRIGGVTRTFTPSTGASYSAGDGVRISNNRIENTGVTAMQHDNQSLQYRIGGVTRTFTPAGGGSSIWSRSGNNIEVSANFANITNGSDRLSLSPQTGINVINGSSTEASFNEDQIYVGSRENAEMAKLSNGLGILNLKGPNNRRNVRLTAPVGDSNSGAIVLFNSNENQRIALSANEDGHGYIGIFENGEQVKITVDNQNHGLIRTHHLEANDIFANEISKSSGSFKIDHPLDPENKFLFHSFVESPDMMNVYNGNVTTDHKGEAVILLPDWFEALNKDFRYQLTSIGEFSDLIIATEVNDNQFSIKSDKPNIKVSWQVTGIRKDKYAEANRIQVEVDKSNEEKGFLIHPELWGKDKTKSIRQQKSSKIDVQ